MVAVVWLFLYKTNPTEKRSGQSFLMLPSKAALGVPCQDFGDEVHHGVTRTLSELSTVPRGVVIP